MNAEPSKPYIYQPLALSEFYKNNGKIFRVVFNDGSKTPLLTKKDAEYVLSQTKKFSVMAGVRKALVK